MAEWGYPEHPFCLFDVARGIELSIPSARLELLEQDSRAELPRGTPPRRRACGLVEAPRGPLIHHYEVQHGLVTSARFVIPTQHNMLAIERALLVAARRYVSAAGISLELERAVGRVVRAFDPCIACATQ